MVTAVLAGLLDLEAMVTQFSLMGENLFVGLGDDRVAAKRSIQQARRRMERRTSSTLE